MILEKRFSIERSPFAMPVSERVVSLDWTRIKGELDEHGCASAGAILSPEECAVLTESYEAEALFRSRVVMAKHGFGRGEYKYYTYPLPDLVDSLRESLYPPLALIANLWQEVYHLPGNYPINHKVFIEHCHASGQCQPTPLLLRYGVGDYNCLHQDIYGNLVFPLQVAVLLSVPGDDFTGGEFVVTEQRPRMQSRVEVLAPRQGEGIIFGVNQRPVQGTRGIYRVTMRHGVSRLHSGRRFTLGIIFHDAKSSGS